MCIMGWVLVACGVPPEHLTQVGHPHDLDEDDTYLLPDGVYAQDERGTSTLIRAIQVNDDDTISDPDREHLLIELLSTAGVELSFKD